MSLQLSLIPTETATTPVGLEYHRDFLAASEEEGLLAHIDNSEWLTDLSRRVLHFGYKYDYTSRRLDETARIGPLPEWLTQLSNMVRKAASEEAKQLLDPHQPFEQAIINEYLPGQGIAPHIDRGLLRSHCCDRELGIRRSTWISAAIRPGTNTCSVWSRAASSLLYGDARLPSGVMASPNGTLRHLERPKDQAPATRFDHVSHHRRNLGRRRPE